MTPENIAAYNISIFQHIDGNVSVTFPQDKVYSCKEDIEFEAPDWTSGPCDMMAYSYNDLVYNGASDACYKILHNFTVINWCTYENNPSRRWGLDTYSSN